MTNSTKATVLNGTHTGKVGFYNAEKVRDGKVIVMFTGRNMSGARLSLSDLENAG